MTPPSFFLHRRCGSTAAALYAVLVSSVSVATAQDASQESFSYDACLAFVETSAQGALDYARRSPDRDHAAARHCEALALSELGRHGEAAALLDALAEETSSETAERKAAVFAQASAAWLLARRPDKAGRSADSAVALAPLDPNVRLDRAAAAFAAGDPARAEREATAALDIAPDRIDFWVFRARIRIAQGDGAGAAEDVRRALTLDRDDPDALALRAALRGEGAAID